MSVLRAAMGLALFALLLVALAVIQHEVELAARRRRRRELPRRRP